MAPLDFATHHVVLFWPIKVFRCDLGNSQTDGNPLNQKHNKLKVLVLFIFQWHFSRFQRNIENLHLYLIKDSICKVGRESRSVLESFIYRPLHFSHVCVLTVFIERVSPHKTCSICVSVIAACMSYFWSFFGKVASNLVCLSVFVEYREKEERVLLKTLPSSDNTSPSSLESTVRKP